MESIFNTELQSFYEPDSFENIILFGNAFNSSAHPKPTNFNFETTSRGLDREGNTSNEVTFQSSHHNHTALGNLDPRGDETILQGEYYGLSSVSHSPSHVENGVYCDLDLAPGMGIGIPSLPKDIMFNACLTQSIHRARPAARASVEPIKKVRRVRANDRERRRMKSLNRALESLKKCIPVPQSKRRVTKLEVLRIACSYIRSLSETLSDESDSTHPFRKRGGTDTVVNGFSVAQRLEILSSSGATCI